MMAVQILMFSGRPFAQPPLMSGHLLLRDVLSPAICITDRPQDICANESLAYIHVNQDCDELGDFYLTVYHFCRA